MLLLCSGLRAPDKHEQREAYDARDKEIVEVLLHGRPLARGSLIQPID
jgi:hypothetical protein